MTPELSQNLIQHLIEIGASGRFEDGAKIPSLFPSARSGSFMRLTPRSWYEVAVSLDDAQLIACIKTLTILERLPNFGAGSVSPVIWLFRKLSERSHDDLTPVIDWVLSHTDNPYLPFGSHNLGAHSLVELHALSAHAAERAKARHTAEENRQREAKARKAAEATHKLFGALRRHDEKAVIALLSQGANIHALNEQGQTAFEYARPLGLQHLLTPSPNEAVDRDAPASGAHPYYTNGERTLAMINTFLSRPNWIPKHIESHLDKLYLKMAELGFEAQTIGKNITSLASPFEEVVNLMNACECTIVLGIPQIRVKTGKLKDKEIEASFSLPSEWNQIEAAISIMLEKPTLMMLHQGVVPRGLFERGAANVFVYQFHTFGPKWVEDTVPKLLALKAKVRA